MEIIYNTSNNGKEPTQEVFLNMLQSSTGNLPLFLQISEWKILSTSIIQNKHQLRYYKEGLTLCTFAMNYLEGNRENKLSYTMLELGIDCLKSLSEFFLNKNIELNSNFRELIKDLLNRGFDVCKENVKESLKEEGLFLLHRLLLFKIYFPY